MCGIAGIIGERSGDQSMLAKMGAQLAHRGPDDEGIWSDPECGIAFVHRRLSVVDLSPAGHQPMLSASGRFVLNFNGEIYNHGEVRSAIEQAGAAPAGGWRGHSDTETLLEAIAAWGLAPALERCVGMFAFALWDREERKLCLVRDRFGEKPLYYGWAGRDFLFASELKAIRCHPSFAGEIDRGALSLFAGRSYIPAPLSIYRGMFKLEPGCILELGLETARRPLINPPERGHCESGIALSPYWSYRDVVSAGLADPIRDEQQALDELERALARSIEGQSMADVPVGAFLSGGIDSSTVVALYRKYSRGTVRTFTIGFAERGYNEADDARAVARALGTEHHECLVTAATAQEVIPRLPSLYDEPFADSSQIPTYLVSDFARQQVKVALSGDGGDELFGGYNRYVAAARLWAAMRRMPRRLRAAAGVSLGSLPPELWRSAGELVGRRRLPAHFGAKVRKSLRMAGTAQDLEHVFASFLDEWAEDGSPVIGAATDDGRCRFDLDVGTAAPDAVRMMYCDAVSYLPDDILCKVDRAAMGVSLETRVPFLDHRVAALATRIPLSMKIARGKGKHILRELLYREAPSALFERPKAGFAIPVGEWIRGPLRDWAESLLDPDLLRSEEWFDVEKVQARWRDHLAGRSDCSSALWPILMFQAWLNCNAKLASAA